MAGREHLENSADWTAMFKGGQVSATSTHRLLCTERRLSGWAVRVRLTRLSRWPTGTGLPFGGHKRLWAVPWGGRMGITQTGQCDSAIDRLASVVEFYGARQHQANSLAQRQSKEGIDAQLGQRGPLLDRHPIEGNGAHGSVGDRPSTASRVPAMMPSASAIRSGGMLSSTRVSLRCLATASK